MTSRITCLALITMVAAFISIPTSLHGQQATDPQQHEEHHPAGAVAPTPVPTAQTLADPSANMASMMAQMRANDGKLGDLVKKMNAATGSAKTEAIAELLTAIVDDRKNACEPMMASMISMMSMMGGRGGSPAPAPPKK